MNQQYGIATPKSDDQKQALSRKFGRDHFFFQGEPEECIVPTGDGDVPALRWNFDQIDPMMRISLAMEFCLANKCNLKIADELLRRDGVYFVQADYEISYTDQKPGIWSADRLREELGNG